MTRNNLLPPKHLHFFERAGSGKGNGYHLKKAPRGDQSPFDSAQLPTPDASLITREGGVERYLETGKRDAELMRAALVDAGVDNVRGPGNFLDFGCGNSRILRWFADWAEYGEAWGVDINASMILWAHQFLAPPFHFAVSTSLPKLPFENGFHSLVFASSVFTEIDDLYLSWICEIRRILKPGGLFFVTIHDEVTEKIQIKFGHARQKKRAESETYEEAIESKASFYSAHRNKRPMSSFRRGYFVEHMENYFEFISATEHAHSLSQPGLLFKKK